MGPVLQCASPAEAGWNIVGMGYYVTPASCLLSCWVQVLGDGTSDPNAWNLDVIASDAVNGYIGLKHGNRAGAGQKLTAYNYDGAEQFISVDYVGGRWHHLLMAHHNGVLDLYLDGRLVGSTTSGDTGTDLTASTFYVGGYLSTAARFDGRIADVRTYSGVAVQNVAQLAWSVWHPSTRWELYGVPPPLRPPMIHVEGGPTALTWLPQGHTRGERPPILIEG